MEVIQSKGKPFTDPFIYLGAGGTAYMYYRLYNYAVRSMQVENANLYLGKAVEALKIAEHLLSETAKGY